MATLTCSNEQLRLIQDALELYSRIGIMQLDYIKYHPSVDPMVHEQFRPKRKQLMVGDKTERGDIVEIGDGYIKTESYWSDWKERYTPEEVEHILKANPSGWYKEVRTWTDIENIKLSIDYGAYHERWDEINKKLNEVKNLITGDPQISHQHASYSISRSKEGQHNIDAYDMIQVIRHEFWKANPNRSSMTVDSSICKFGENNLIKVEL